jgi:acetyl esterase/lipase
VFPGGGYRIRANHEGELVAMWLNSIGISAFVLNYRVAPYKHPYPLEDAKRAIRYVRYNAEKWNIDPEKVGILGFSAGGHLASTVGTHFDLGNRLAEDPIERISSRPDAMVLCYPVITFGEKSEPGTIFHLIGEKYSEDLRRLLSNEIHVSKDTPPIFLWHTANDNVVPVDNSIMFANSLAKYCINYELHIFSDGPHGMGLAKDNPYVSKWTLLCESWLRSINFIH